MISVAKPVIDNEEINAVVEVLKSGNYTSGKITEKFEKQFASYIGSKYAIACNSGTAALHMVYRFLNFNSTTNFITTPMSFFATISAGLMCNSYPIFVDVNERCNIDSNLIEKSITEKTIAIVPVHFYGHPCDMEKIMEVSQKYNIPVIEDCAQAHGAEYKGKKVGSFGFAGCFSFFATKNITTIEGGMITTNSEDLYNYCRKVRSHGMLDRNTHEMVGYNYRMSEVSSAMGIVQLSKLDVLNEIRIKNSLYLQKGIKNEYAVAITSSPYVKDVYFWQPIYTDYPHQFMSWLKDNDIGFRHRYWYPLYKQQLIEDKYKDLFLPMSEKLSGCFFGLPNYPALTTDDLQTVVEVVNAFIPD